MVAVTPMSAGLPGDQQGGRNDFLYGGTLIEGAWEIGVDFETFLGRTYNRSRLYRDDAHCNAGYVCMYVCMCAQGFPAADQVLLPAPSPLPLL